jgi:alcohol dehydrogenase (cytochrome c)
MSMVSTSIAAKAVAKAALCGAAVLAMSATAQAQVSWERLQNPEPENWLMYGGNLGGWRFSELDQINRENAADLSIQYIFAIGGRAERQEGGCREESILLVDNGNLYTTDCYSVMSAWDISSGSGAVPLWAFNPEETKSRTQRGVALFDDGVFIGTNDTRLIRVNSASGEVVFDVVGTAPMDPQYGTPSPDTQGYTTEPIVIHTAGGRDLMIQGESTGGQSGTISYVVAADAATGEIVWRRFTVPFPGEPGHETWEDDHDAWKTGGAGVWSHGTYDPETNLVYHGTGDIFPTYDPEFRPGDNLFGSSTIALNADTGEMAWYFQIVPNESWDYDQPSTRMLYDSADGVPVVGVFARSGHFYTHNRENGEILGVFPYTEVNWTAGIDPKTGRPVDYVPGGGVQRYAGVSLVRGQQVGEACPNWSQSAVALNPPSFDPNSRLAYLAFTEGCVGASTLTAFPDNAATREAQGLNRIGKGAGTTVNRAEPTNPNVHTVAAYNVDTGERVADVAFPNVPTDPASGTLTTAGGLVVHGDGAGNIYILDAESLEVLKTINVGMEVAAPASTWMVNGRQYIGMIGGGNGAGDMFRSATAIVLAVPE